MANLVWCDDEVSIHETVNAQYVNMRVDIHGVGTYKSYPFTYRAVAQPSGWYIEIYQWSGPKKGEFQGATFNLPLEVAAAARRLL